MTVELVNQDRARRSFESNEFAAEQIKTFSWIVQVNVDPGKFCLAITIFIRRCRHGAPSGNCSKSFALENFLKRLGEELMPIKRIEVNWHLHVHE